MTLQRRFSTGILQFSEQVALWAASMEAEGLGREQSLWLELANEALWYFD